MRLRPYRMQPEAPNVWTVRLAGGELVGWFRTEARAQQVLDLLSGRAPAFGEAAATPAPRGPVAEPEPRVAPAGGNAGDDDESGRCGVCGAAFPVEIGRPSDRCPAHRGSV